LPDDSLYLARSYDEAVKYVQKFGIPNFISFDHDLGIDENNNLLPSGYDFAKWLVESDMDKNQNIPYDFKYFVHSANPVGKENIQRYLNSYLKYKRTY
jgi:hypothetical protein